MYRIALVLVAAVSMFTVTGCKKKGGAAGEAMAKMEGFSKDMCACKDKACADKVNEDMTKWGAEMAKTAGKADEKPDPEMARKSADIMTKYSECMTKLMMASAGAGSAEMKKDPEPAAGSAEMKKDPEPAAGSGEVKADDKPAEMKADDKKADDKKADDKKADDKKADDKKADDKKPDDKKAGGW